MPQDLTQAQQATAAAQAQLKTAQATLSTDTATLDQAGGSRSADRAKLAVDCAGDNAGESVASSSGAGGAGSGSGSTPWAAGSPFVAHEQARVAGGSVNG